MTKAETPDAPPSAERAPVLGAAFRTGAARLHASGADGGLSRAIKRDVPQS